MPFIAKLQLDGEEMNVLQCNFRFAETTDPTGLPTSIPTGGYINLVVESTASSFLFDWMISLTGTKNGSVTFFKRDALSTLTKLEFNDAYCVEYYETFNHTGEDPMRVQLKISAGKLKLNGSGYPNGGENEAKSSNDQSPKPVIITAKTYISASKTQNVPPVHAEEVVSETSLPEVPGEPQVVVSENLKSKVMAEADKSRKLSNSTRPSTACGIELPDGSVVTASSKRGSKPVLHPEVQDVMDSIPEGERSPFHGSCAEPQIISQLLDDGKDVAGSISFAVNVSKTGKERHGEPKVACDSCKILLKHYKVKDGVKQ